MIKNTLLKATKAGANEIRRFFNGQFTISNKEGINNLVTEADHVASGSYQSHLPVGAVPEAISWHLMSRRQQFLHQGEKHWRWAKRSDR